MELFRALGALLDAPCSENRLLGHLLELGPVPDEPTHNDLFLFQLYPYASAFLGEDGRLGGEAQDRVAGFWRALGADPPAEPDHLRALLGGYARLVEAQLGANGKAAAALRDARHAFLWEHLLSWVLPFLLKLRQIAPPFYRSWADTLETVLSRESALLGPPTRRPLALREASPVPDPRRTEGDRFLLALLSPARSGLVLTRADLARAARDLGLGLRVGERAYILRSMLAAGARGDPRLALPGGARVGASPRSHGDHGAGGGGFLDPARDRDGSPAQRPRGRHPGHGRCHGYRT